MTRVPNDLHSKNKKLSPISNKSSKEFLATTKTLLNKTIKFCQNLLKSIIDTHLSLISYELMSNKTLKNLLNKAFSNFNQHFKSLKVISMTVTRNRQDVRFYLDLDLSEDQPAYSVPSPSKININYHYILYLFIFSLILISIIIFSKKLTPHLKQYFPYSRIK